MVDDDLLVEDERREVDTGRNLIGVDGGSLVFVGYTYIMQIHIVEGRDAQSADFDVGVEKFGQLRFGDGFHLFLDGWNAKRDIHQRRNSHSQSNGGH